jgi:hypothetical protein
MTGVIMPSAANTGVAILRRTFVMKNKIALTFSYPLEDTRNIIETGTPSLGKA